MVEKLKEHWPFLALGALLLWAFYPAFLPEITPVQEHPLQRLSDQTDMVKYKKALAKHLLGDKESQT